MELNEKKLTSKLAYDGGPLKVYYDTVELVNGKTAWREIIRHPGAVVVVPVDDEGNTYLVRQFRYPYGKVVTEVPAGKLEYGEDHFEAARRELEEEIGAQASEWIPMGEMLWWHPTPFPSICWGMPEPKWESCFWCRAFSSQGWKIYTSTVFMAWGGWCLRPQWRPVNRSSDAQPCWGCSSGFCRKTMSAR